MKPISECKGPYYPLWRTEANGPEWAKILLVREKDRQGIERDMLGICITRDDNFRNGYAIHVNKAGVATLIKALQGIYERMDEE